MVYKDTLRKEITPKRLLSFLNLINLDYYTKKELKDLIYPKELVAEEKTEHNMVFNFAKKVSLIEENAQGRIELVENPFIKINDDEIDENSFKNYLDNILFYSNESVFHRITKCLLKMDGNILEADSARDIILILIKDNIKTEDNSNINEEIILAWRFWAKYLGYAYNIMDEFIIVNPYEYIHNLNKKIFIDVTKDEELLFGNYISKLINKAPIFEDCIKDNQLSFPLSLALLTLHNDEKVNLSYTGDAKDIWRVEGFLLSDIKRISSISYWGDKDEC